MLARQTPQAIQIVQGLFAEQFLIGMGQYQGGLQSNYFTLGKGHFC
jgi:hypothetical protein